VADLSEIEARGVIEREVAEEYRKRDEVERGSERDRAVLAMLIVSAIALAVAMPLLAVVAGVSVRLFRWAAGW
jgi:hypothetical protein